MVCEVLLRPADFKREVVQRDRWAGKSYVGIHTWWPAGRWMGKWWSIFFIVRRRWGSCWVRPKVPELLFPGPPGLKNFLELIWRTFQLAVSDLQLELNVFSWWNMNIRARRRALNLYLRAETFAWCLYDHFDIDDHFLTFIYVVNKGKVVRKHNTNHNLIPQSVLIGRGHIPAVPVSSLSCAATSPLSKDRMEDKCMRGIRCRLISHEQSVKTCMRFW